LSGNGKKTAEPYIRSGRLFPVVVMLGVMAIQLEDLDSVTAGGLVGDLVWRVIPNRWFSSIFTPLVTGVTSGVNLV
jgi:hypothetical protein